MKFEYLPGATPLDPDETLGLIPTYITTLGELNELEGKNIENAMKWLRHMKKRDILNLSFTLELHKQMFFEVWKWAGKPRTSGKNIGVSPEQIMNQLGLLFRDTEYWINHQTYTWSEIGARFHLRLVAIHIFSNGNGRHSRLMTDVLLENHEQEVFTWGSKNKATPLEVAGPVRNTYISALKAADLGDFDSLLKFMRS
jgi:Fic-DOC domain mobile mystery protein B